MIKLSDRLQKIANSVNNGETMADIGTDHGFLPIYLVTSGISPRVIMSDISEQSLMKSKQNSEKYIDEAEDKVDFRVGDGLCVLEPAEVDVVVVAGMGGKLIVDILAADMNLTCSFKKFIFQPRIGQGHLRKWLLENGFVIIRDDLVREGRYIPEIITALSPGAFEVVSHDTEAVCRKIAGTEYEDSLKTGDDMLYKIPPWIISADGPVEDFLLRNIDSQKRKLESVMLSKSRNHKLEDRICDEIYYLKGLLKEYKNGR